LIDFLYTKPGKFFFEEHFFEVHQTDYLQPGFQ